MNDASTNSFRTGFSTHFARWYTPFIVVLCAVLLFIGAWASALGVLGGAGMFLLKTRRVRYAMRSPLSSGQHHSGMFIYAGSQAMIGLVCLFVGALFKSHLILFFSATFGTWQLSMAIFLGIVISAARRGESTDATNNN